MCRCLRRQQLKAYIGWFNNYVNFETTFSIFPYLQFLQERQDASLHNPSHSFQLSPMPTPPPPDKFLGDHQSFEPNPSLLPQSNLGGVQTLYVVPPTEFYNPHDSVEVYPSPKWDSQMQSFNQQKQSLDHKELIEQHQIQQKALLQHHKQQRSVIPQHFSTYKLRSYSQKSLIIPKESSSREDRSENIITAGPMFDQYDGLELTKYKSLSSSQLSSSDSVTALNFITDTNYLPRQALCSTISVGEMTSLTSSNMRVNTHLQENINTTNISPRQLIEPQSHNFNRAIMNQPRANTKLNLRVIEDKNNVISSQIATEDSMKTIGPSIGDLRIRTLPSRRRTTDTAGIKLNPVTLKHDTKQHL